MKAFIVLLMLAASANCFAVNSKSAIRAIVGEASGEPYETQVAIAAVIRNRHSLKGVYGLHAPHIRHETKATFKKAAKAWAESAKHDPTHGCNSWGGICDDWYFIGQLNLKPAITIGNTRFYKTK